MSCTGGERGDVLNPQLSPAGRGRSSTACRQYAAEMAGRGARSGVQPPVARLRRLGPARGRPAAPAARRAASRSSRWRRPSAPLVQLVREFRPHVITTYDPIGRLPAPRPHHVPPRVGRGVRRRRATRSATAGTASRGTPLEAVLQPRLLARADAGGARRASWPPGRSRRSATGSTRVQAREVPERRGDHAASSAPTYFPQRDDALRAHATQIDPDGFFFAVPRELEVAQWPTEEYELASPACHCPCALPRGRPVRGLRGGPPHEPVLAGAVLSRRAVADPAVGQLTTEARPWVSPGFLGFLFTFALAVAWSSCSCR